MQAAAKSGESMHALRGRPSTTVGAASGGREQHRLQQGDYNPCSATGVLENYSVSVVAVLIEGGAHHLDLMFSKPLDPEPVKLSEKPRSST
ncbi:hypothetical protein PR003_g19418 [Phytophthora rubi]|uniref:Uncharacterized protein n=1 Tax=Phytophthora rubi TaxID=129364 RepID=A0A6A3JMD8_9STRA|nr:hypothetical protein PR002_g19845 [Phytophthora rubi]KAE9005563.1 hypothetical protein PR001_g17417 [Phytophthora rubi]KAE9313766.1 hypothetical protein PR003_g19418 [Phytophthora rubi]